MSKDVRHAVIIQPDESLWGPIQEIRRLHDKAFVRWMPHINLLYPFVPESDDVIAKIRSAVKDIAPFTISLNKFSYFAHSPRSCTLYLDPNPTQEIMALQAKLEQQFPECDDLSQRGDGKFAPHLTLGQFAGEAATKQQVSTLSKVWSDMKVLVSAVHVISRTNDEPFKIVHSIPLGEAQKAVEKKSAKISMPQHSFVDNHATASEVMRELKDFSNTTSVSGCVFIDMQQIAKVGVGLHVRKLLLDSNKMPGVFVCCISAAPKQTMVRCDVCERPVGKLSPESNRKSMLTLRGDFHAVVSRCSEINTSSIPFFSLPEQTEQFLAHFGLVSDESNNYESLITSHKHPMPSHEDSLEVVVDRIKRWMKKTNSLPTTKPKLMNATRPLRMTKGSIDPSDVLLRIAAQNKLKFCVPCKKFTLTPSAYVSEPPRANTSDVDLLAAKTVGWLCHQPRAPASVKDLLTQIESFSITREFGFEEVWNDLVAQGIVTGHTDGLQYNLEVIQVAERVVEPSRSPATQPISELPITGGHQPTSYAPRYARMSFPFDKVVAQSAKQAKPRPVDNFDDMGFKEELLRGIYAYGFEKPSLIQAQVIPALSKPTDAVIQSPSGTGKTAAYCLPMLQRIDTGIPKVQAIILVPTRELASQVHKTVLALGDYLCVRSLCVVGGASVSADIRGLAKGVHVIVGTCGRVLDMINRKSLEVTSVQMLILDEGDELLSTEKDTLKDVVQVLPSACNFILVSSTFDSETEDVWNRFMQSPILFLEPRKSMILSNFKNVYIDVPSENEKLEVLADLYEELCLAQAIIFCNTKRKVDWLQDQLKRMDFTVAAIHGDISQNERDHIFTSFRNGSDRILITTSQLSRGLDIHMVETVVNYDFPSTSCEYYHRMGRAGRFGRKGVCINFLVPQDNKAKNSVEEYFNYSIKMK